MSEYYGAPNDFRNYLEHKYDDRWVRYNKKGSDMNQKEQATDERNQNIQLMTKFEEAQKLFLRGLNDPAKRSAFKEIENEYRNVYNVIKQIRNENRYFTSVERALVNQFVRNVDRIANTQERPNMYDRRRSR